MTGKTPVTVFQELCMKKGYGSPCYELLADGTDTSKTFIYKIEAFGVSEVGQGKSKKDAKHEAAVNILNILQTMDGFKADLAQVPQVPRIQVDSDAIGTLLDICVQRNWPIASFEVLQASGAPHSPEFTVECRVASIVRVGTCSTKKRAKQLAAQEMLYVIQNMPTDECNLQIAKIDDAAPEKLVKTYRDLKNSDIKSHTGILLCDRHLYFKKFENSKKEKARQVIFELVDSPKERVHMLCNALNINYKVSPILNHMDGDVKVFELIGDFDCVISGKEPELYNDVIDYFIIMLSLKNSSTLYMD